MFCGWLLRRSTLLPPVTQAFGAVFAGLTTALAVIGADVAAVHAHELLHHRQADAGALEVARAVQALEHAAHGSQRIDRTRLGEKAVDLPCCGVFEMRNGKIQVWRDYFDMGTYMKALAG